MPNTIYLYIKTHNVTGLKYLGKTTQDPNKYRGSGLIWKSHIKKHGYDVTTEVLFESTDKDEFNAAAISISKQLDIVESPLFANLCPEEGQGGYTSYSKERNAKISKALKGRTTDWVKKGLNAGTVTAIDTKTNKPVKISKALFDSSDRYVGVATLNKGKSVKRKSGYKRTNPTSTCPHCNKEGAGNNMTRYHFDNCKLRVVVV